MQQMVATSQTMTSNLSATDSASPHVTIRGLSKRFGSTVIYDNFDLDIPRNKFTSVFGPNGCGKSTLINMITNLLPRDSGEILIGGKKVRDVRFGYVFQNYREALFPWLRSIDNIRYPLKFMDMSKAEQRARVDKLVEYFGVKIDLSKYPYQLSGGQQQLISIMRSLGVEQEILFLDDPFSALDYEMTLFMRDQLQNVFMETKTTMVLVSHDLEEAVYLADHILLLSRGPAEIADFVDFDLARPRHAESVIEASFISTKAHCLEIFQREVRKG